MDLKQKVRAIPDFPKKGIIFRDITTLIQDADSFNQACNMLHERYKNQDIDKVAGIEARGFIFGAVLANKLGVGFVPVRKKGKLPYKTICQDYLLEYGQEVLELHEDAISEGEKILLVDDLIATGGTVVAATKLIEKLGGIITECAFIIELPELKGRQVLAKYPVYSIISFDGH